MTQFGRRRCQQLILVSALQTKQISKICSRLVWRAGKFLPLVWHKIGQRQKVGHGTCFSFPSRSEGGRSAGTFPTGREGSWGTCGSLDCSRLTLGSGLWRAPRRHWTHTWFLLQGWLQALIGCEALKKGCFGSWAFLCIKKCWRGRPSPRGQ